MTYNELKRAAGLLNAECKAGIKCVGIKSDVLESEFVEASRYFAGEAEKTRTHLSEELQAFFRDITGEELHQAATPATPDAPATPASDGDAAPGAPGTPAPAPTQTPGAPRIAATPPSVVTANVPVPEGSKRRRAPARYPFADMEMGHSFFVPCTEGRPDPAKSMQSTVSSAVRKFSIAEPSGETRVNRNGKTVPVMIPTKMFVCRAVNPGRPIDIPDADPITDGAPWGFPGVAGAAIWRIA
jgi:hypothetical protein